jgi:hypothetical protein
MAGFCGRDRVYSPYCVTVVGPAFAVTGDAGRVLELEMPEYVDQTQDGRADRHREE